MTDQTERFVRGTARLSEIDSTAAEALDTALGDIAPDLARYIKEYPFGDIYSRPGLSLQQRQVATVAMLAAMGTAAPQLKVHIGAALNVGLSREEIVEICLQVSVYAGFPAAINAVLAAKEVFAQRDADAG